MAKRIAVTFITREFPPHNYGGAGVHLEHLSRELRKIMDVEVRCFGEQSISEPGYHVRGYAGWEKLREGEPAKFASVLETFSTDLAIVRDPPIRGDVVHTHTWYSALAGFAAKVVYGVPLVVTIHSLEPMRPWKQEQLGAGYHLSTWVERLALENADRVIAVSGMMKKDILAQFNVPEERVVVIHNGIDLREWERRRFSVRTASLRKGYGINGDYVLFVGRATRQKGMVYLIDAADHIDKGVKVVFCTSAADTKEVQDEMAERLRGKENCVWIDRLLTRPDGSIDEDQYMELYSNAVAFACPSVYEPFGIINLEAMATGTPVVASEVGGIVEVVVPGETGELVPPKEPMALAEALNSLIRDRKKARRYGKAGRRRVEDHFGWDRIAEQTKNLYESIVPS